MVDWIGYNLLERLHDAKATVSSSSSHEHETFNYLPVDQKRHGTSGHCSRRVNYD